MNRVFKSKVDWWYHLLLFILFAISFGAVLTGRWIVIAAVLLVAALAVHVLLSTYYIVTSDGKLTARCSIFPRKELDISRIEALERTILPVFSYSLSLNRIAIWSEGKMWLLVSPQNEKDFIKLLREHNPDIKLLNDTNYI